MDCLFQIFFFNGQGLRENIIGVVFVDVSVLFFVSKVMHEERTRRERKKGQG